MPEPLARRASDRLAHRVRTWACALALTLAACGAEDRVAPYSAPPPDCPEADDYLQPLYQLEAEGKLTALAETIRHRIPDSARRDMVDALLTLLGAFQDGDFAALKSIDDPNAAPSPDRGPGLQLTLGRILRWVVTTSPNAPNLPLIQFLRRTLATCEGAPVFSLLADAVDDDPLVGALLDTLASPGLADGLAGLDFEGANGREAMSYLVRNLLVSASSSSFDVANIVDLLGLLVDLDQPPYRDLADGLERLLDADGLPRLQGFLVCLQRADPDLVLGAFLYDVITSGLLSELGARPGATDDPAGTPGPSFTLSEPVRKLAVTALRKLADDAEVRRGLDEVLLAFLADDVAPPVLDDIASLLEAEALSGVFELVVDLASHTCRLPAQSTP